MKDRLKNKRKIMDFEQSKKKKDKKKKFFFFFPEE